MAGSYLSPDRDQVFLLPPDMRDWLPEDHVVWFVLDVVDRLDTSVLHARHRRGGPGRRAYDPDMMLALLLYAYAMSQRSSRQIERLCQVDVAFRVLVGGLGPDHTTIARFRQDHGEAAQGLFVEVLELCRAAGLVSLGVIAVDGTKMSADASMKANRSKDRLRAEVAELFDAAGAQDAAEDELFGDTRGDELPEELRGRNSRKARLDEAIAELERRQQTRRSPAKESRESTAQRRVAKAERFLERFLVEREQFVADRKQRETEAAAQGRGLRGARPRLDDGGMRERRVRERLARARASAASETDPNDERDLEPVANVTDPASQLMKSPHGWVQGYNAQAAVSEDGIVCAAQVTQDHTDYQQCVPMMAATLANLSEASIDAATVGVMLFDAGYFSEDNIKAQGPTRLIADSKSWKLRNKPDTEGEPPADANPTEQMSHRLRTAEGRAHYKKRQHTVEPVFGDTKHLRGFRRFSRRGLTAVDAEWTLQMTVHNIMKMFRTINTTPAIS